jgi:lipopolysaccharide transport system permease protein
MSRMAELSKSRELIANLTLRELRSKYKRSFLGWGWSLLNPLLSVAIYWLVFGVFLDITPPVGDPSGLSSFVLFLLAGLLPFLFFQNSVDASPEVLVANGNLIKKTYFRREVLVISAVGALLITFLIELGVLLAVFLVAGNMVLPWIPVTLFMVFLEAVFVLGIGLLLSVLNVYFRDVKHFVKIALQLLFYATPILYPISVVPKHAEVLGVDIPVRAIYELNPLVPMVTSYRSILYDLRFPDVGDVLYFAVWAFGMLAFGWWVFSRLEGRLAEEV